MDLRKIIKRLITGVTPLEKCRENWKLVRGNNFTEVGKRSFDCNTVSVGNYSYGIINLYNDLPDRKLIVGNFCSIGDEVSFILGLDHELKRISTYPFRVKIFGDDYIEAISKGDIVIKDDVWIGHNATILSGVTIGQGAVIAAGAVVSTDIPPYAIAAGVPARVVKYRFSDEIISQMIKIDYGKLDETMLRNHMEDLYKKVDNLEQLEWLPKK